MEHLDLFYLFNKNLRLILLLYNFNTFKIMDYCEVIPGCINCVKFVFKVASST